MSSVRDDTLRPAPPVAPDGWRGPTLVHAPLELPPPQWRGPTVSEQPAARPAESLSKTERACGCTGSTEVPRSPSEWRSDGLAGRADYSGKRARGLRGTQAGCRPVAKNNRSWDAKRCVTRLRSLSDGLVGLAQPVEEPEGEPDSLEIRRLVARFKRGDRDHTVRTLHEAAWTRRDK